MIKLSAHQNTRMPNLSFTLTKSTSAIILDISCCISIPFSCSSWLLWSTNWLVVTRGDPFHFNSGAVNCKVHTFCTLGISLVEVMLMLFLLFCLITFSLNISNMILGSVSQDVVCKVSVTGCTILSCLIDVEACKLNHNSHQLQEHNQLIYWWKHELKVF